MSTDQPQTQEESDAAENRHIARQRKGSRRSLYLTVLIIALFGIDFFWSSHTASTAAAGREQIQAAAIAAEQRLIAANQKAIASSCDFWYPLTGLPVAAVAGQPRPTELSVQIIAGARESYAGQCQADGRPPLPPAAPSLIRWSAYYHVHLP